MQMQIQTVVGEARLLLEERAEGVATAFGVALALFGGAE